MPELPEQSNFYATVETDLQPFALAGLYRPPLWQVRACSWTDYEATSEFAELVIESSNPVLVHGAVADFGASVARLIEPPVAAGLAGSYECYDAGGELLFGESFGSANEGG